MTAAQIVSSILSGAGVWITYPCRRDKSNPDEGREEVSGIFARTAITARGLTIHLTNGNKVLWPMGKGLATEVDAMVRMGLV